VRKWKHSNGNDEIGNGNPLPHLSGNKEEINIHGQTKAPQLRGHRRIHVVVKLNAE